MEPQVKSNRNAWLDTLRGISASWIVIFHLNGVYPHENNFYTGFACLGYYGIHIFFILSGYCIRAAARNSSSLGTFYWRRFCRIYPSYLVNVLFVLGICALRKLITGSNDIMTLPNDLQSWFATLTITTAPASSVPNINWVYWTLSYEIFFYFVAGLILLKKQFSNQASAILMVGITLLSIVPSFSERNSLFFFLDHWGLFALGVGINSLINRERIQAIALIILGSISIITNNSTTITTNNLTIVVIVVFFTAISIYLSEQGNKFLLRENILTQIGTISYSLYLIHVPVGCYILLHYRYGIWMSSLLLQMLYDFGVLLLCIGLSILFFYFVERPSMRLGKKPFALLNPVLGS